MSLEKKVVLDSLDVTATGHLQIRHATYVEEDGVRISGPSFHRYVLTPGDLSLIHI